MEINDQKLEQILTKQKEDFQRYLGVVVESFESQVKLIAESMIGMQNQLTAIRDMVAKNTKDIEEMKIEIHINTGDITEIKENINIIRGDLRSKTSQDEFTMLEGRVAKLEKTVSHKN